MQPIIPHMKCCSKPQDQLPRAIASDRPYLLPTFQPQVDGETEPLETTFAAKPNYASIRTASDPWLEMACEEATLGVKTGGGPFGAILLQFDPTTSLSIRYWRAHNQVTQLNDPTAHAEVRVIRAACRELEVFHLNRRSPLSEQDDGAAPSLSTVLYSSTEPCPMCFAAIAWARIPTVVFATTRHHAAAEGIAFSDADIYAEMHKPLDQRCIRMCQANAINRHDAFELWKHCAKTPY